jgi:C_GCAxxG_C_C family probable redox protein
MTEEEINHLVEQADALHEAGFNCAQSVFGAFAPGLGLEQAEAVKIAAALGGGIARTGETCGAVSGALLALGLQQGSSLPDPKAKDRIYAAARQFLNRYSQLNGSTKCRELLGCDISTPEGLSEARARNLFKEKCPRLIRDAVVLAGEMMDGGSKPGSD